MTDLSIFVFATTVLTAFWAGVATALQENPLPTTKAFLVVFNGILGITMIHTGMEVLLDFLAR